MNTRTLVLVAVIVVLVGAVILSFTFVGDREDRVARSVSSFEECVSARNPVMESYPRQCRTEDGRTFTEYIGNELEKADLIRISAPRPNEIITSPLLVKGEARGFWFFEASLPVTLIDSEGNVLIRSFIMTADRWVTEDFVPFEKEFEFDISEAASNKGTLILHKDNPSGLPEYDDQLVVPVGFEE